MIEMHTLQSKYQDIQIRATKAELHIIPLLTDGSYEDRTIIPRDSRAGWYVGNRYFETERGSGPLHHARVRRRHHLRAALNHVLEPAVRKRQAL